MVNHVTEIYEISSLCHCILAAALYYVHIIYTCLQLLSITGICNIVTMFIIELSTRVLRGYTQNTTNNHT